jgi:HD-GYP domain-containing protein (c-di-GMP phosphodiesterase class II)
MDKELLIKDFENRMEELGIRTLHAHALEKANEEMYSHDRSTFYHNLSVARIARKMAELFGLDGGFAYDAGDLHDEGKLGISSKVLNKTRITDSEKREIQLHPFGSYEYCMQKGLHGEAHVSERHHRSQNGTSYPTELHEFRKSTSESEIRKINEMARIVSVADCCDALKRMNDYLGGQVIRTQENLLEELLKQRPYSSDIVLPAFQAGILQNGYFDRKVSPQ